MFKIKQGEDAAARTCKRGDGSCDVDLIAQGVHLTLSKGTALSPFVNLGMQHDGRRAEPWMKKVTTFCIIVGGRKGFAREHQNGLYVL